MPREQRLPRTVKAGEGNDQEEKGGDKRK